MASILVRTRSAAVPAVAITIIAVIGVALAVNRAAAPSPSTLHRLFPGPQLQAGTGLASVIIIAIVLFLAGVVSGLAGFAFSAVAACVLWLLPPLQAVPLIMLLSACNQLLSIGKLRQEMVLWGNPEREGALPYIIGGLAGVPVGVALLRGLPTNLFAGGLGMFLISYSTAMLVLPGHLRIAASGRTAAAAVGALGGVVGGFSGFSASVVVVYLGLRGFGKSATRGITQPYILTMQLVSLGVLAAAAPTIFDAFFWLLWALTLPAVLLGSATGVALYRRLSDSHFRHAVLFLLILSGASLVAKALT